MKCFRKWPCCLLISVIFVFPPIWAFHEKNICARERLCKCHRNSAMVDIICTNIKSLYPVQNLLWNQFSKTLVNKLILSPNCELTSLSGGDFNTSIRMIYAKCPFSNIAVDAFRHAKSLININLDATTFSNIPEGLSNLKNLNTLKINHGRFVSLGREPWNLSSLLFLHLPNGQLKELHKDSLKMSEKIMVLDLPFNKIRTIHPDTFDSLKSLYSVNLRCNHIVTIDGLFKKLNYDLKKLDLYDNELTSLDNAFHDGTWNVQSLNIGKNPIDYINSTHVFGNKFRFMISFYMQNSNFAKIDPMLLKSFPMLMDLHLEFNKLKTLPDTTLSHLQKLRKILLNSNEIISLGGLFHDTPELEILNLANNNITSIKNSFTYVPLLKYLNLFNNKIQRINNEDLQNLEYLSILYLDRNNISIIEAKSFSQLRRLRTLDICHNPNLRRLNSSMQNLVSLIKLSLCSCSIQNIATDDFVGLINLHDLRLMDNAITTVNGVFRQLRRLTSLNICNNRLTTLSRATLPEKFNLTKIWLAGNPWQCDCRLIWLIEWLNKTNSSALMDQPICNSPQRIRGKPLNRLTLEDMTYSPEDCPEFCRCMCVNQMSKVYIDVDCSNSNLTHMPRIFPSPVKFLDLSNNALEDVSSLDSFQTENLINLNLEQNKISVLGNEFPKNLEVLKLSGNQMKRFPWSSFSNNSLREVTLSHNPWICDCKTVDFRIWLLSEGEKVTDINDTKCGQFVSLNHLRGKVITSLTENDICPSKLGLYLGICTGSLGLLFLTATAWFGYRRYRLHVIVWLYSHGYTSFKDDNIEEEKMFDGYLVYCSTDAEFALTEILPGLEEGEPAFNICVSARDVILGQPEVQAALNPVGDSKRIILILSRYFINDELCISIFRAAFAQFLEDKVHRLIMIKKDDLPLTENVDSELKIAMTWSNCLTWGDNLFWEKLRYAMPKKVINTPVGNVCEVSQPEMYLEMQLEHN